MYFETQAIRCNFFPGNATRAELFCLELFEFAHSKSFEVCYDYVVEYYVVDITF